MEAVYAPRKVYPFNGNNYEMFTMKKRMKRMQSTINVMPTIEEEPSLIKKNASTQTLRSLKNDAPKLILCQMCWKTVSNHSECEPVATSCEHVFCKQCFEGSFSRKLRNFLRLKPKCPACKVKLSRKKPYVPCEC
jgi:hypothetical protein